jgi:SnoaL-like domain
MNTPQVNDTLQEIIDYHEIRKLLAVYCHGCDRGDETRMASAYAKDSWDEHGTIKGSGKDFAAHVMNHYIQTGAACTHSLGQSLVRVNGNEASAETYFVANIARPGENGGEFSNLMGGRYVDAFVRENGQWKIAHRIAVRDWSIGLVFEKEQLEKNAFIQNQLLYLQGQQSGQDPSYSALGLRHPGLPRSIKSGAPEG